ncbi:H-type lectin domain-containing protein [Cognatishimia sp. MH4019]|uniref:H-type lectin domain-containing protein n=1 Tax=Cognatishimia sp. MH4019 TaxID=2854030 RepID=UPI001CD4E33C|nr:H-type lectin domain-containing protein [Cognatishimia sp. MH4019]
MMRLSGHSVGVQQGEELLFSDYQNGGEMWTGTGPRERRTPVTFDTPFSEVPTVQVAISLWDLDRNTNLRADIQAEQVTAEGFEIVFRTWGDTRIARIRATWTAIGTLPHDDDWQLY